MNALASVRMMEVRVDMADPAVVRLELATVANHPGGLGTRAVNGAVIAGMFDAALGAADLRGADRGLHDHASAVATPGLHRGGTARTGPALRHGEQPS